MKSHMEEDAGKLVHDDWEGISGGLQPFGVPLIEIVSEPDMRCPLRKLSHIWRTAYDDQYLGASDCKLEGSMRADATFEMKTLTGFV